MERRPPVLDEPTCWPRPTPQEDRLNRALVAGLMLEVMLEAPGLPEAPEARRRLVKARLQDTLVSELAGRVTLDRFRHLTLSLDRWFSFYYPLISPARPGGGEPPEGSRSRPPQPGAVPSPAPALKEKALEGWLRLHAGLLPRRRHSKLTGPGLLEFLRRSQGAWFRLKDFERHFGIDRKTAWEYLQKFLRAGLLFRNQGRSTAGRFALAAAFLRLDAPALRARVDDALAGWGARVASQVGDWLIATGGEAFWEEDWRAQAPGVPRAILQRLKAAALLEVVQQSGQSTLVRLPSRWLK